MSGRTQKVACGLDTQSHLQLHCEFGSPVVSKTIRNKQKNEWDRECGSTGRAPAQPAWSWTSGTT